MTAAEVLMRRQAQALADAMEAADEFAPESERLIAARLEPGQPMDFTMPMLIAEMAEALRVQIETTEGLRSRVDGLEAALGAATNRVEGLEKGKRKSR
jgi:hypothetical protein